MTLERVGNSICEQIQCIATFFILNKKKYTLCHWIFIYRLNILKLINMHIFMVCTEKFSEWSLARITHKDRDFFLLQLDYLQH